MQPEKLVYEIIKEQSLIIGEQLAKSRAEVSGAVKYRSAKIDDFSIDTTNPAITIETLISSYEKLFGKASAEVCFSVIKRYPQTDVAMFLSESIKSRIAKA